MSTAPVTALPHLPDKYDIIPIHASDLGTYKGCRRRWDWTSPARRSLRRKVTIFGVNPNLWYGTGIHYALQNFYDPLLKRDPVETFLAWYELQMEGGLITEDELELSQDPDPVIVDKPPYKLYQVKGLKELLPEYFEDEWLELKDLGVGMMKFYKEYAQREDNFIVVAAESMFSVPLGFEAIDTRVQSPNYGKKLEVHARGKRDAIIQWEATEHYGIIDHKTAGKMDDDYFRKLDKDPQCSTYLWASQEEAVVYDLPWTRIEYVLYNVLRKVYPRPPTILQSGLPSVDRQKEGTTAEMFEAYIRETGLVGWFESEKGLKAQGYYTWLLEQGDRNFIIREPVFRNVHESFNTGQQIREVAREMLSDPAIYPNPTGEFWCVNCTFRAPCIAADDGSDVEGMLEDSYELNRGR